MRIYAATVLLIALSISIHAQNVGIGITNPTAKLHIECDSNSYEPGLTVNVNYTGTLLDIPAISTNSISADGYGYGGRFTGGFMGAYCEAIGGDYHGYAYGVYGVSHGTTGYRIGVYGAAGGGARSWAGYFNGPTYIADTLGIGVYDPKEILDVSGAIRLGTSPDHNAGAIRYLNGLFEGNTTGTSEGWKTFNGPWVKDMAGNYYLSPVSGGGMVAIGDSLLTSPTKLKVRWDIPVAGGTGVHGLATKNGTTVAEGHLGYQYGSHSPFVVANMGVLGTVYHDSIWSRESFGAVGNNYEQDSCNYGIYGIAQGHGNKNIGVFGFAQNGINNWAGYLDGDTHIKDRLMIGTDTANARAKVHIMLPSSGNFEHVRIESPSIIQGFGIMFKDSLNAFILGQNIGNWNDGRFGIFPNNTHVGMTMMQNGDVGLMGIATTPFARLQVQQKGSINNGGALDVTKAAIFIGVSDTVGIAFDENQIESVGSALNINFNSDADINLVDGGGNVGVGVGTAKAKFHIGEGETVLLGKDIVGDGSTAMKLMWIPNLGGAFRAGQLNYDGSIAGNPTVFWDAINVGWGSVAIGNNTKASGTGSLAIGIRSYASNFGSVAIGHLSQTRGNSAVAAGYYTRADAFVGTAVGSGNVGGGSPGTWVATDPIFEVGNSIDTSNRSNAFTVLKNARVGINHSNPQSMLDIEQPNQGIGNGVLLNLATIGHWETSVDNAADFNFYFNNVLKGYILDTDGSYVASSDRRLKTNIQPMKPVLSNVRKLKPSTYQFIANRQDSPQSIGFIAQEVEEYFPEVVSSKDDYLGINYSAFAVIAIQAIKELADDNDALKNDIKDYQNEIEQLETRMNEMQLQIDRILQDN